MATPKVINMKPAPLAKTARDLVVSKYASDDVPRNRRQVIFIADEVEKQEPEETVKQESTEISSLSKSIINHLNGPKGSIERLAFEVDPTDSKFACLYEQKLRLLPDDVLKRVAIQDDLVASIAMVRSNQTSAHGEPRAERFATGFVLEPNPGVVDRLTPAEKAELDTQIAKAVKKFATCGSTKGWDDEDKCSLATWLSMSTRNAIINGKIATEIIWAQDAAGNDVFHSFRAIDAGTIYRAAKQQAQAESVRETALRLLEQIKNKELEPEKYKQDQYSWVQVINGTPRQAFTSKECVVYNFYPVTDVELNGYPVTPIDTMMSAVTTHINITAHNRVYFQTGRATRGMLVIQSDDVDESVIGRIKQQFNASINSVQNAWRMPVFGVGKEDSVSWSSIDSGARDMEFQYLTDMNARVIFSAFQMSPEEVPGWAYLSKGTNNQALSESNNEYKLEAARDVGIRPLLTKFQDFLNSSIFPLIDAKLAEVCKFKFVGLDADTPEKESVRLQQDIPVHMTYDQVMRKVEKQPIGKEFGGEFPLQPQIGAILDAHFTVGEIEEHFMGRVGASQDPALAYRRDQFWFSFQQLQQQAQQAQMQQQQAAQQAQQGGGDPNSSQTEPAGVSDEQSPGGAAPGGDDKTKQQQSDQAVQANAEGKGNVDGTDTTDLTRSLDQAIGVLTKSEDQLPPSKRRILAHHKMTIKQALDGWETDLMATTKEILAIAEHHSPAKGK